MKSWVGIHLATKRKLVGTQWKSGVVTLMLAQQNTVEQDFAQHWWLIDSTTRVVCVTCLRVLCKSSIHFTAPRKLPTRRTPVSNSSVTCASLCRHFLIRGKETTADSTLRLISSKLQMRWVDVLCLFFAYVRGLICSTSLPLLIESKAWRKHFAVILTILVERGTTVVILDDVIGVDRYLTLVHNKQ